MPRKMPFVAHNKSHIQRIEQARKNQSSVAKKPFGKPDLLLMKNNLSGRQQLIGYFFLLLVTNAHIIDISAKTTASNSSLDKNSAAIKRKTPKASNDDKISHQDASLKSFNNTTELKSSVTPRTINSFNAFVVSDRYSVAAKQHETDKSSEALPFTGCPMAGKFKATFTQMPSSHVIPRLEDELKEETPYHQKLDPVKTIQRVTYYQVYLIEYNDLYAHYPYFSLVDHCNHLTQLSEIYGTIIPLVKKHIDLDNIKPCVEKESNICSYGNIHKYMYDDLTYFQQYLGAKKSFHVDDATQSYIDHLNEISDYNVLFGHLMVLIKLNMHGGHHSVLIGLVDIFRKSGISDFKSHKNSKEIERIIAGTDGAMSYIPNHKEASDEINQWMLVQMNHNNMNINSVLKGYLDCFKYLSNIYKEILDNTGENHIREIESQEKVKLYTPQEVKQYRAEAIEDNILVQMEHYANYKYSDVLKKKGFTQVVAADSEFSEAHAQLYASDTTPDKLPKGTLKIGIIEEDHCKMLHASWFDGSKIQENKTKITLPSSLNIDSSIIDRLTEIVLQKIPHRTGAEVSVSQTVLSTKDSFFKPAANEVIDNPENPQDSDAEFVVPISPHKR